MKAQLATVALVVGLAGCTLWYKTCAEADLSLAAARSHSLTEAPLAHVGHLTFAAQQRAPWSSAAEAEAQLVQIGQINPALRFWTQSGQQAAHSGSRSLVSPAGLRRVLPPGQAVMPEAGALSSPTVLLAAEGPNRLASVLASLFFLLWIGLAAAWAWRGHTPQGSPTKGRWRFAAGTAVALCAWLISASFV